MGPEKLSLGNEPSNAVPIYILATYTKEAVANLTKSKDDQVNTKDDV
jgi:hypothetical protein